MIRTLLLAFALLIGVTPVVFADATYAPFLVSPQDRNGEEIKDGTATLVLDLDGDGWDGVSYLVQGPINIQAPNNAQSWLWDSDDYLMAVEPIEDGLTPAILGIGALAAGRIRSRRRAKLKNETKVG